MMRLRTLLLVMASLLAMPSAASADFFLVPFAGVKFGYLPDRPVLAGVELVIHPGQALAKMTSMAKARPDRCRKSA